MEAKSVQQKHWDSSFRESSDEKWGQPKEGEGEGDVYTPAPSFLGTKKKADIYSDFIWV